MAYSQWIWLLIAAFLIGISKTSISGFMMPAIPIIAGVFGGKESTGMVLPLLISGDIFALYYYNRHGDWKNIKKIIVWVIVGLILGIFVGNLINDRQFKTVIAVSVIICLGILVYMEKKGDELRITSSPWFYAITGILTGFTTMIGNAAGPIFSVYLLAGGFKKNDYLGTTAWAFFIINIIKLPLQIIFWHNITLSTLKLDGLMLVPLAIGAVLGAFIVKKIDEKPFRIIIIVMTAIAAIKLLF